MDATEYYQHCCASAVGYGRRWVESGILVRESHEQHRQHVG
jgi:hypothetical protein